MRIEWKRHLQFACGIVRRNEGVFALVFLGLLAFAIHKSALHGYWRFDDGFHLNFVALYSPWQYFLQPSVMLVQSYANVTPYNALFYEINLAFFGMEPRWHYVHLIVILAATAFSTYRLMRLWQEPVVALLCAILFLGGLPTLHVAQQLMTGHYATGLLFSVLSLHSFTLGVRQNRLGFVVLGAALYLLATTCKEVYVPLLLVLPAIPVGDMRSRVKASLPYLAVAGLYTLWRYAVLGQLMGGYIATPVGHQEQFRQLFSVPLLMAGWLNGVDTTAFFLSRGGLNLIAGLAILALIAIATFRKRIVWTLVGVSIPLILIPLQPLTGNPGINEADRYLFLAWWACSVLLATLLGSLRDVGVEYVAKCASGVGFVALLFNAQMMEHQRITPRLAKEDTLYQTVMHMNSKTALMPPPPNQDSYRKLLSGARQAAALLEIGTKDSAKFAVDKASLCEYTEQGNTILEFDEACGCVKDVTSKLEASLAKLLGRAMNSISGVPLRAKLTFRNTKLQWDLGPFDDGVYSVVFGSSPTKVPAHGGIPWAGKESLRFKLSHESSDGKMAISPFLEFDMTKQSEFRWEGNSIAETFSCASDKTY